VVIGCESGPSAVGEGAATQPSAESRRLSEGYALLYGVVSQQRRVDGLFALKQPRPAVRALVSSVGSASGAMYQWMEDRRDVLSGLGVTLDAQPLPEVEAAARSTIQGKTTRALMFGSNWQRELVLSQVKSTDYLAALADAIAERETSDERAGRLRAFAETMRGLNEKLVGLIALQGGGSGDE